jgi:preprotein translocase subunit SecG
MERIIFFLILLFLINSVLATNDSLESEQLLEQAERDYLVIEEKGLPLNKINDTLNDAKLLYYSQIALENSTNFYQKPDYKLVNEYAIKVSKLKELILKTNDELIVFLDIYSIASQESDLSDMDSEYDEIVRSFEEERFEDTLNMIPNGYNRISEIQASQTTLRIIYLTTSRSIKTFLYKYWFKIVIILFISALLLLIFWRTIRKYKLNKKLKNLKFEKESINELIKKAQKNYFKDSSLSQRQFKIKIKRFKEIERNIEIDIIQLKESLFKINKKK